MDYWTGLTDLNTLAHKMTRLAGAVALAGVSQVSLAGAAFPGGVDVSEIGKYLVIATGEGTSGDKFTSYDASNVEIGADQELVSNSDVGDSSQRVGHDYSDGVHNNSNWGFNGGLDLTGDWVPNDGAAAAPSGNRFNDIDPDHDGDTVGIADLMPGARPVYEGIDYSGNVALTGVYAQFQAENVDVNADTGIECKTSAATCDAGDGENNVYFDADGDSIFPGDPGYDPYDDVELSLGPAGAGTGGVSQFDPTDLIGELTAMRDYIVGLDADYTFNSTGFTNRNIKDDGFCAGTGIHPIDICGSGPVITDIDAIDALGDGNGIAVIDINAGDEAFLLNNTDWILQSASNTLVIFRMKSGAQFDFSNSSVLLGDGTDNSTDVIRELGAIFFMDAYQETNEVFNNNNVILGGIGLWDFTDFNPNRTQLLHKVDPVNNIVGSVFNPADGVGEERTLINLQDAQGCAQFISNQVLMSNNRWNRCFEDGPTTTDVPLPGSLPLLGIGAISLYWARRRHNSKVQNNR